MTALELFRRGIHDHLRALVAWCFGVVGYVALITAIFPSIHGSPDFERLAENYPEILKSFFGIGEGGGITTGAGYIDIELFSLMLPLLVLVMAVGSGARTFAGEEDAGRLELVLAYPVRRRDAVLAKSGAVAGEVFAVDGVELPADEAVEIRRGAAHEHLLELVHRCLFELERALARERRQRAGDGLGDRRGQSDGSSHDWNLRALSIT